MSILFRKENGFLVDLELGLDENGDWFLVRIKINGEEQLGLSYQTKYPMETRKAWKQGFFAGLEYAKKEGGK